MVAAMTVGCMRESEPPMRTYAFHMPSVSHIMRSPYRTQVLKVSYPVSVKFSAGDKMVYDDNGRRGAYLNTRWANDLGTMLQGTFIDAFSRSGAFKAVVPYDSLVTEDLRLETVVYDVVYRVRGDKGDVFLSIEATLVDGKTGKLVKSKRFTYDVPTETVGPDAYAQTLDRITASLVRDMLKWLLSPPYA
jgi:cholesterol transport system auxiliary component